MPRRSPHFRAVFTALLLTRSVACGETVIPKLEGDALDPDANRAPIVALDAILFDDGPLGADHREEVAKQLLVVADVASKDPSNTIAMVHGRELRQLADIAKRTKVGTPRVNSQLRQQWFRIRSSLFADAWWFRRSSRDPIEKAVPDAAPGSAVTSPAAERRVAQAAGRAGGRHSHVEPRAADQDGAGAPGEGDQEPVGESLGSAGSKDPASWQSQFSSGRSRAQTADGRARAGSPCRWPRRRPSTTG